MNHLLTKRKGAGLEVYWQVDMGRSWPMLYTRIAIGVSFPDETGSGYCCVVAERTFWPRDQHHLFTRYYAVIDEARTRNADEQVEALIRLKDMYLVSTIYAQKCPYADALRRIDGLTHYSRVSDHENRAIWPTFEDIETVAGVRQMPVDDVQVSRDLDALLNANVVDPDSGQPKMGGDFKAQPKLQVFGELNTKEAAAGLQPGMDDKAVTTAVWLAATGLDRSRPPEPDSNTSPFDKEGRRVGASGY